MFMYGQGFGKEISEIKFTWYEPHVELQLTGAVADPIEAHVDGFGFLGTYCAVG